MATILRKLFHRKKQPPLVCSISLDDQGYPMGEDPDHKHTAGCFIDFEPLAVVELFQSQSCQACFPAISGILQGANHPTLLLLTYNVTLFDHMGWKDTFAKSAWDQRQRAYAMKQQHKTIFTPQVIVNGVADGSGAGSKESIQEIVQRARAVQIDRPWHIYLDANDTDVRIDSDAEMAEEHDIIIILFRSGDEKVKIGKGPNKGVKFDHRNVVTDMLKIGKWTGGDVTLRLPASKNSMKPGENAVVLVQEGSGGPIVAVAKV
ncbi:uncharacterized protein FFUJ_09154 [Fusarium fujikuroi IMI 58289]|uniref:Uncharacterized protein n=1 Tax=Gibberella fujikuroi (strain CBS 195.34 / IMI 58289 / NRRL A-6831) TaxID=1279085 RepID=S0EEI6_GIBF5|nr:uncharacterized protein FFUJ_09154 [Fusarium fujikuroi IMI 58289]CCT70828.1 uncharacterized protein FFUJ_09154 [Fusarium fujikuroi IMI 58289]SCO02850.1 uncharacterized protein FFM5_08039 [Fusarium fujikuroi]